MCRHCLHGLQHSSPAHLLLLLSNQVRRITRRRLTSHYAPLENPFVFLFLSPFGLGIEMMNKKTKQNALLYSFLSPPHLAYTHERNLLFNFISRSNDYFTPPREHKVLIWSFIGVVHLVGTWNGGDFPKYGPVLDLRKRSIVFVEITSLDKG